MIGRVVIKNFKSIGEAGVDLELKPLTLLVGPNGGGKSSILEAIAVASQRHFQGRCTQFPSWDAVMHKPNVTRGTIEVHAPPTGPDSKTGFRFMFDSAQTIEPLTPGANLGVASNRLLDNLNTKTFLVSSVRGDVAYSADTTSDPQWVGNHGEDLLPFLAIIFGQRRYHTEAEKIAEWSSRFGISGLKAGFRGNRRTGSDYLDDGLKVSLELALASSGARQILTIIAQLFWAPPGSLLMIEEPEISLHPKAQIDVLEMFAEAIKEQRQVIATTHSLILMQALGYAVHKGWLTPDQVAVHHVEKGKGGTTTTPLPLDARGYIQGWVPSFTEVERRLLREWADTLPRA
jgi:predicted ATPase